MAASRLTRSDFIVRAAVAGAAAGWPAAPAAAAPSEVDLAWVRFGVAAEYVSADYYRRARRTGLFSGDESRALERATAAQLAHHRRFRQTLIDNGQAPIEDDDLEVVFPDGAFETRAATVSLGRRIGGLMLHAYLGAVTTIREEPVRRLCAQVSASEAEQLAYVTGLAGRVITDPFPPVHGLETAADQLASYLP